MDYRKIITSRKLRVKLLRLFRWIPDKAMVKLQYRIKFGRSLNLKNPQRFTEKLQWYKLYYHNPQMTKCAGKNDVREYVESRGLKGILNHQYGAYRSVDEIDFDSLPDKFVIKGTVGAAGQKVYICQNKAEADFDEIKNQLRDWVKTKKTKSRKNSGREWAYNNIEELYVVEEYIDSSSCENGLLSYKIFCFNGKAKFLYVIADIKDGYFDAGYGIYTTEFERMPYNRVGEVSLDSEITPPNNLSEMILVAERLAEGFPHVRVDLYNVDEKIIFGEMTFYNDSGYMKYNPDEFDYIVGDMFVLPEKMV